MAANEEPAEPGLDGLSDCVRLAAEHTDDSPKTPEGQRRSGYPNQPGWRTGPNSATSQEAASAAAVHAGPLKDRVLALLDVGPASPEELQAKFAALGERVLLNTVRARCSDLHALGRLRPSGTFARGESGKVRVIRWRLATADELSLFLARKAAEDENGENPRG